MSTNHSKLLLILSAICLIFMNSEVFAREWRTIDDVHYETHVTSGGDTITIRVIVYTLAGGFSWACATSGCMCSNRPSCVASSDGIYLTPGEGCAYGLCDHPAERGWYFNHCYNDINGNGSSLDCSVGGTYCIWEQVGDCDFIVKDEDDYIVPIYEPISLTLSPRADNPDTTFTDSLRYMPMYDSVLVYELRASHPMTVEIELGCSMYEGIAMNAPVPDDESEKKADMKLIGAGDPRYSSHTAIYTMQRDLEADEPLEVEVKMLDYAAKGRLRACQIFRDGDRVLHGRPAEKPQEIPRAYDVWLSNADPDSDGFTLWEEYRGFVCLDSTHFRLDLDTIKTRRHIILLDPDTMVFKDTHITVDYIDRLQQMMGCSLLYPNTDSARMAGCSLVVIFKDTASTLMTDTIDGGFVDDVSGDPYNWEFYERIDRYQGRWNETLNRWEPDTLTNPHYIRPAPYDSNGFVRASDQVAIRLSKLEFDEAYGLCFHKTSYGICGNAGITYSLDLLINDVTRLWPPDTTNGGTGGGWDPYPHLYHSVLKIDLRRLLAHELGHAINAPDHGYHGPRDPQHPGGEQWEQASGTALNCVMLNNIVRLEDPYLPNCRGYLRYDGGQPQSCEAGWEEWINAYEDHPNHPNTRWGFYNDRARDVWGYWIGGDCADSIRFRQ